MTQVIQGSLKSDPGNFQIVTAVDYAQSAAFSMGWTAFTNTDICAQVSGTATSVTAVVERADVNPAANSRATIAPADATGFSGDPATGIPPNIYSEPGTGWWRIRVSAVAGGSVNTSLSGVGA